MNSLIDKEQLYCNDFFFFPLIFRKSKAKNERIRNVDQGLVYPKALVSVNAIRSKNQRCGLRSFRRANPLRWNQKLAVLSARYAMKMYNTKRVAHIDADGFNPSERVSQGGYNFMVVGENIASGYTKVDDAINGWRKSCSHCKNMMNPIFKEVGISSYNQYWVMLLGAQNNMI